MTILTEGATSFYLSAPASLVQSERDVAAWASSHIVTNPAIKWVLGKYVEADNANGNGQFFELEDLRLSKPTISHAPMNIDHQPHNIVGTLVASELMYPNEDTAISSFSGDTPAHPFIEVLGAFWKYYFPETLRKVEEAFENNSLFYSMEAVGESVTCGGDNGCGETFPYKGPMSETYCDHIQDRSGYRQINSPHFLAAGLILPPNRPGWNSAHINEISKLVIDDEKDRVMADIAKECPDSNEREWESLMWELQMNRFSKAL